MSSLDVSTDKVTFSSVVPKVGGESTLRKERDEGVDFRIEADSTWGSVQVRSFIIFLLFTNLLTTIVPLVPDGFQKSTAVVSDI